MILFIYFHSYDFSIPDLSFLDQVNDPVSNLLIMSAFFCFFVQPNKGDKKDKQQNWLNCVQQLEGQLSQRPWPAWLVHVLCSFHHHPDVTWSSASRLFSFISWKDFRHTRQDHLLKQIQNRLIRNWSPSDLSASAHPHYKKHTSPSLDLDTGCH